MTIGKVQICNMALSHVGAKSNIESLTEGSAESNVCNLWYDHARIKTLEMYDWSFARKRFTLAAHTDDPPDGVWGYRYQYPTDCLKARYIVNPSGKDADAIPFEVEMDDEGSSTSILTDLDSAVLVYTFGQEDTNLFSRSFIDALAYAIGSYIAFTLTGKQSVKDYCEKKSVIEVVNAAANSHNESVSKPPREAPWIRGRN